MPTTTTGFVVTDFEGQRHSFIYSECYCGRGHMEQMIAELMNGLKADRMSCNKFSANQSGLYLHCAAYVILHSFQADMLVGTELECSTITTMTEKLLLSALSCAFWFRCCFQPYRTDFIRKTMRRRGNADQSDIYCEDKAWWL